MVNRERKKMKEKIRRVRKKENWKYINASRGKNRNKRKVEENEKGWKKEWKKK